MSSEILDKLKKEKEQILRDLYSKCTLPQQSLFNRMYFHNKPINFDNFDEEKIDWAIQQCERTIEKNETREE